MFSAVAAKQARQTGQEAADGAHDGLENGRRAPEERRRDAAGGGAAAPGRRAGSFGTARRVRPSRHGQH